MPLDGIHHVTCITGDVLANVDFYAGVLGLRLVAKSVNQDDPTVYHLFFSDEEGHPGADITFFGYEGARPGRAGTGMIHTIVWRVASAEALAFWAERLGARGVAVTRDGERLGFADPEGLGHELTTDRSGDAPRIADHPEIPAALALHGFDGVRAYGDAARSRRVLEEAMGARPLADGGWEVRGPRRGGWIRYEPAPAERGVPGAGTVHHVAWGTTVAEHPSWVERLSGHGVRSTEVIDRHYFHSIYFREPGGVLYEIADDGPGFARDSAVAELGRRLILPPWFEAQRAEIEARLTPIPDPRAAWGEVKRG
ncbi:MAG: VOC family protein [Candidatus Eisenbacteria bacterium]|nr:VOC family protein [Candidatus Eisenbacteria bacterium]